eukprot:72547_1
MAAIIQDSSDQSDDETEWGWDAMKNWWNPAGNKGCKKAERNLLKQFVDNEIYKYESSQISINYDPEPISIKQKKLKHRSKSFSLFSFGTKDNNTNIPNKTSSSISTATVSTSALPTHYKKFKNDSSDTKTSKQHKTSYNEQFIHTLSFSVKHNKLQSLINNKSIEFEIKDNNIDNDEEFYHSPNHKELNNDSNAITGKGNQFMKRSKSQSGTSCYELLQKQLHVLSKANVYNSDCIPPIILTPGYGCGGGMFIPSITNIYQSLLSHIAVNNSPKIYVIDWLGNGMSSRPEFECETTQESENWFVDSLEEWRKSMNIAQMILSGHSLGGYMCAVYAMKYPQYIKHLILVSPVGLPSRPKQSGESMKNYNWKVRTMMKTFGKLWNYGWTPHDIIRLTGPKGKSVIESLVEKRLFRLSDNDVLKGLLAEYLFHVVGQQGSGEYALNKILEPGAWAYNPLVKRIGVLKQYQNNNIEEKNDEKMDLNNGRMKIDFIYGETDWMTSAHAVKLKEDMIIDCDVYVNPDCGHQLILENANGFGKLFGAIVAKGHIMSD